MLDLFRLTRGIRQKDGSARTTNFSEWIAWLIGHPGALAHQILSIRQNIETLVDRWKKNTVLTRPSTAATTASGGGGGHSSSKHRPNNEANLDDPDASEDDVEVLDEAERQANLKDENDAKHLLVKIFDMCEGTVEEMISVVAVSGNLSLRATMSGFDVHRIFYDDMEEERIRRAAVKAQQLEELREKQAKKNRGF